MSEWILLEEAVAFVALTTRLPNARELLESAIARHEVESRECDIVRVLDDGTLLGPPRVHVQQADGSYDPDIEVSVRSLHEWVDRLLSGGANEELFAPPTPKHRRYASDEALVQEGKQGLGSGKWPNAHAAAKALAHRAEGTSFDAKVQRLRKGIVS